MDCSQCNAALQKDLIVNVKTSRQQEAYLHTLDKDSYELLKKSGSVSLSLPIVDALLTASTSWDDFRERRDKYLETVNFSMSRDQAEYEIRLVSSRIQYESWVKCIQECSKRHIGFYAWKTEEDADGFSMTIYFNGPPGAAPVGLTGEVIGGTVAGAPVGKMFKDGEALANGASRSFIVSRISGQRNIKVLINADGYGGETIKSSYDASVDCVVGTARIEIKRPGVTYDLIGVRQDERQTPELHEKPPQATDFSVRADPDCVLRNPRFEPVGPPPVIQGFINSGNMLAGSLRSVYEHVPEFSSILIPPTLRENDTVAYCRITTWSRAYVWRLSATEYKPRSVPVAENVHVQLRALGSFSFKVPKDAVSVAIWYQVHGNGEAVIKAGENSADGFLRCVRSLDIGDETAFHYRVELNAC